MLPLIRTLFEIVLLRKGPEDLPRYWFLLVLIVALWLISALSVLALIERFEKQRLPRLQELKRRTDKGERLSDGDIKFLDTIIHDAQQSKHLMDRHPE